MASRRRRGQRVGLTRERVLDAALALVDREGLAALSMRRLGAELGVEAMTLYHHVANKAALLDGLVERIFTFAEPPLREDTPWREAVRAYARALHTILLRHPAAVPLVASRPALTTHNLELMEASLTVLHADGFSPRESFDIVYAVTAFTVGYAATRIGTGERSSASGGFSPPGRARYLPKIDPDRYPLLAQALAGRDADDEDAGFDYALDAMLSGFSSGRDAP
ncbi:MAG TPA: TetR/AcrR family transcriptional regulator C-terminal domain-containing protein [Actinopolymorphaceae bacterium]